MPGTFVKDSAPNGGATIETLKLLVAFTLELSETCAVNVNCPALLGVPDKFPLLADSVNPPGSDPEVTDHAYGGVPPVAAKLTEYGAL